MRKILRIVVMLDNPSPEDLRTIQRRIRKARRKQYAQPKKPEKKASPPLARWARRS